SKHSKLPLFNKHSLCETFSILRKKLFLHKQMQMQDITKNNFDFLRVLLAFIVFVGHLGALSSKNPLNPNGLKIFEHSPIEIAVFGFFVVSGFLIARSYDRSSSLKSYLKKRIKRIVP